MNFFEMFLNRLILAVGSHIFALDFGEVVINADVNAFYLQCFGAALGEFATSELK